MPLSVRAHKYVISLQDSVTKATAGSVNGSEVALPGMVNGFAFILDVTAAATAAGDTLNVFVQTKIDGTNWLDVVHFAELVGDGGAKLHIEKVAAAPAFAGFEAGAALGAGAVRDLIGDIWRIRYTTVETSAVSYTFSVAACPM